MHELGGIVSGFFFVQSYSLDYGGALFIQILSAVPKVGLDGSTSKRKITKKSR